MINRNTFFRLKPHSCYIQPQSCNTAPASSSNFTVELLPYCYLSSLFLYIENICQSFLVTSDNIRHYQPVFPQVYFALLMLKLLYLKLYLSNHLGPTQGY